MRMFERWMLLPGAMVLAGIVGAVNKLIYGEHALGTSAAVPWGMLIAGYVFFAAAATGVGLISGIGHFTGRPEFLAIEKRGLFLALSLLLPGFGLIGIELGNPLNMIYIILSPNFSSGIWWMGFLYSIYMGLLFVECYLSQVSPEHKSLKFIGAIAILNKIAAVCNLGAIFALIATRPFWYGPYFPVYILVTAVLSGAAAMIAALYLTGKRQGLILTDGITAALAKIMAAALIITAALNVWKIYSGLNSSQSALKDASSLLFAGPLAARFWGMEVVLGILLPLVIVLLYRHNAGRLFYASIMVLTGVFFMRLDFIAAGQIAPQMIVEGVQHVLRHSYSPSWTEAALLAGAVGASVLLYAICEKRCNLSSEKADTFQPFSPAAQSVSKDISLFERG